MYRHELVPSSPNLSTRNATSSVVSVSAVTLSGSVPMNDSYVNDQAPLSNRGLGLACVHPVTSKAVIVPTLDTGPVVENGSVMREPLTVSLQLLLIPFDLGSIRSSPLAVMPPSAKLH